MGDWLVVYRNSRHFNFLGLGLIFLVFGAIDVLIAFHIDYLFTYRFEKEDEQGTFFVFFTFYTILVVLALFLSLYNLVLIRINRSVDGKEYSGKIVSSLTTLLDGVTLQIFYEENGKARKISTNSFMSVYCANCVGEKVNFHLSKKGFAIIDEITEKKIDALL